MEYAMEVVEQNNVAEGLRYDTCGCGGEH